MSQENVEAVRLMLDAFARDDVEAVVATFDERCELHEPPEMPDRPREGFRGHDGIRRWMAKLRGTAAIVFEPVSFTDGDGVIVSEWAARGQGEASGVPFQWKTFVVLDMRRGKIARAQAFLSRQEALEAAGLSP